jgi:hypothetical protein
MRGKNMTDKIWLLYTECDSEPSFHGYLTNRKDAVSWVKNITKRDYNNSHPEVYCDEPDHFCMVPHGRESNQYIHCILIEKSEW